MRRLRRAITVVILVVALLPVGVLAQGTQQVGRWQLVSQNQGTMFLVDTATGRVWRYTKLTDGAGKEVEDNPCKGLATCFVEIDRLRLLPLTGRWISEIY